MSPEEMMASMSASMKERTGRTLDEWVELVHRSGVDPMDQNAVRRWLKSEHGLPQNSQWAVADAAAQAAGWVRPTIEQYIDSQYEGPKAELRPIFDRIRGLVESFGDDVTLEGRSTYTPFVRARQFAAVAAATRTRIDVGLRFTDPPPSSLFQPGSLPGQATHKISLSSVDEVTDEVERLLSMAYDQNG